MMTTLQELDQQLFLYLNNLGSHGWDWFWLFMTSKWSWIPLYILLFYSLIKKVGWKIACYTLLAIALLITFSDQTSNVLKQGFHRWRPCHLGLESRLLAPCGKYGFPSAHAFSSMALAIFVGKLLKPYYKHALPALLIWSVLVGYSRVYVGVHYPGDISVGFALGVGLGYLFYTLFTFNFQKNIKDGCARIYKPSRAIIQEFDNLDTCFLCRRNYLPIGVLLILAFLLYLRSELYPGAFILEGTPYEIYYEMFAVALSLTGAVIRVLVIGYPYQHLPKNPRDKPTLNTSGIYSLVRHPLYLGNFLLWLGITIWTGSYWFISCFCLVYWIYYEWIVSAKEDVLQRKFGMHYQAWAERTPAFFPRMKNYVKPAKPFNWRRVLQRERNALFMLFFTFCFFNVIGEWLDEERNYNYFLILMSLLTGMGCLILNYIVRKTALLEERVEV